MPMHQIKSRYSDAVLYECDVPDDVASGLRTRYVLEKAVAARANLAGANLAGANLASANLDGAKWRDGITINRAPLQLHGLKWDVYILDQHMQIGCELHTLAEWAAFDDARIVAMDGRYALRFWRAHKAALLALAASDGRGVETQAKEAA